MGQVIKFPDRQDIASTTSDVAAKQETVDTTEGAKVLFFTGVRYERPLSLPSTRLAAPVS